MIEVLWLEGKEREQYPAQWQAMKDLREEIFYQEQGASKEMVENTEDKDAMLLLLVEQEKAVATGRLLPLEEGGWKIGRIAVRGTARGRHLGTRVVEELEKKAREKKRGNKILVMAQLHAVPFYQSLGFTVQEGATPSKQEGVMVLPMIK